MDTDSGRGSRSEEQPPLAMVRRLHLDELGPGAGIAEDDWYETERLTGHITGRARSNPGLEQRLQDAPTVVLDWRHTAATPPATVLGEWRRGLAWRRRRLQRPRFPLRAPKLRTWAEHRRSGAVGSAHSTASFTAAQTAEQPVGGHIAEASAGVPRLELRHASEPAARDTPRSLHRAIAAKRPSWRWGSGALAAALAIASAAAGTVGIVSAVTGGAAKPGQAGLAAGAPLRSSALAPTAAVLMQALSGVAHDVRGGSSASHRVPPLARRRDARRHSSHAPGARSPADAGSGMAHATPAAPTQSYTPVVASPQSSAGYRQSSTSGAVAPQHSAPSSSSSSSTSPSKAALRSLINGAGQCSC
jgi:hypothetical protein